MPAGHPREKRGQRGRSPPADLHWPFLFPCSGSATPEALNHTWHDHYYGGRDSYLATLLPNPFYPGPWAVPRSWMVPVGTEDCGRTRGICNGQLKPGSWYR